MTPMYRYSFVSLMALGLALPMAAQEVQQTVDLAEPTSGPQEGGPQESAAQQRARDVVIITAQKREETVQDIAAAVTAVTSEMRDEIGLTTVQDYTNFAPGLTYSTSNDRLGMRGVTRTSNNFGIRSGISNYVDGVYFSSAIPASREPIFTDRVEVVRGPQGTLYGRDSIGGALNVISKRPTDTFEGQFNMGFGNYETRKVEMTMAGPINDSLRYRVGGSRTVQDEGYFTNVSGLETEGGRNDGYYLEAQLEGDIGERFDWWLRYGSLQWKRYGAPGARTGVGALAPYDTQFFNSTADIGPNGWFGLSDPNAVNMGNVTSNPALNDPWSFAADFSAFAYLEPTTEIAAEATYSFDNSGREVSGRLCLVQLQPATGSGRHVDQPYTMPSGKVIESARGLTITSTAAGSPTRSTSSRPATACLTVAGAYQYQENYTQPTWTQNVVDPGGPVYDIGEQQPG
ncbi:MAG: TonB-dependent receptor plug domain-containing protein [Hyphomonadaceae bacterium]